MAGFSQKTAESLGLTVPQSLLARELGERSELLNGEAALVLEPEISAVLELRPFSAFSTPDLVDFIVDELDGVELVEGDFSFGGVVLDAFYVSSAHVHADLFDARGITVVVVDVIREPSDRACIFAFGDVDDLPCVDVDEQGDVVVTALSRGLVDGHVPQVGKIHARDRRLDIVLDDAPQTRVVFAD